MSSTLTGRVAIVTGASRNIGAAIAQRLAADGAAVAINYPSPRCAKEADAVVGAIEDAGGVAWAVEADVSDASAVRRMVDATRGELGSPTILINNAAISVTRQGAWNALEVEDWTSTMGVNVIGGFLCARAVHEDMRRSGGGDIVSLSSITALIGRTGNLAYVTSKSAIVGFTRALAREVGGERIRVNCVIPGAIQTPDESDYGDPEVIDEAVLRAQSLQWRGVPADIAAVVSFLVSGDAKFITGQSIVIDGGWVMH